MNERRPYSPGPKLHAAAKAALSSEWQTVREIAAKTPYWLKPAIRLTLHALVHEGYAEGELRNLPSEGRPAHGCVWVFRKKKEDVK